MSDELRRLLRPRPLTNDECRQLFDADRPAHLGTIDQAGFPHVTPIWFLWDGDAFVMTSVPHRPHVHRLRANPAACVSVDDEAPERDDGQRPNRQMRAVGTATLTDDQDGHWTRLITTKYVTGPAAARHADTRAGHPRIVIRLTPDTLVAVGSV